MSFRLIIGTFDRETKSIQCGTGTKINESEFERSMVTFAKVNRFGHASDCLSVDTSREESRRIDLHLIVNRRMLASFTHFSVSFTNICGKRDDAVIEMQM